jgi:hypothetical protein
MNIKFNEGKKDFSNYREIATARKSTFSTYDKIKKDKISRNIGSAEFQIYKDRISTLRGIKIKPISEYSLFFKREFEKDLDIYPENIQEVIKNFIISFFKNENIDYRKEENKKKYYNIFLEKFLRKCPEFKNFSKSLAVLNSLFNNYFGYSNLLINREGEERIGIDKGIPLKPEYMKIKILSSFEKDFPKYYCTSEETIKKFKKDILKYDKMFIKDDNYNNLIKYIDKVIKS